MSSQKIALVTGSNKGIGFAIVKGLCQKFKGIVYLTSRDVKRGEAAVAELSKLGLEPHFHQLDITDQNSLDRLKEHILKTHGGLDILVNNAAIAFKSDATESFGQQAEETLAVNYFSTLRACETLFPLLRDGAKVVNISSAMGQLSRIPSEELRKKLSSSTLTIPELTELMNQFVQSAKNNTSKEDGWGNSTYVVSKVGLSALTVIQQRLFDEANQNIFVNSVHPGYVDTDMTSHKGPLTIEEGAHAPILLALDTKGLKGQYVWNDGTVAQWDSPSPRPI